jgi:hypothetical protein
MYGSWQLWSSSPRLGPTTHIGELLSSAVCRSLHHTCSTLPGPVALVYIRIANTETTPMDMHYHLQRLECLRRCVRLSWSR